MNRFLKNPVAIVFLIVGLFFAAGLTALVVQTAFAAPSKEAQDHLDATLSSALGLTVAATKLTPLYQDFQAVIELEETYHSSTGKYLQVIKGNKLPAYESGSVSGKLGQNIPASMTVNTYSGPKGSGYFIKHEDATGFYSIGFGPHADDFTTTRTVTATSTP